MALRKWAWPRTARHNHETEKNCLKLEKQKGKEKR
jgi:hypothetical protein